MDEYHFPNTETKDVNLSDIFVDPGKRIRKNNLGSKEWAKHEALKRSMSRVGLLHSITLLKNYELKAGFGRYSVAIELGWQTISCRIFLEDLTEFEELLLEITENHARKDFTSIELFTAIARLKRLYEEAHPEVKQGKARWEVHSPLKKLEKNQGNKVASNAILKYKKREKVLSFVKSNYMFFGMAERTLRNYTRIGEACLNNKFSKETIALFEEGKLTQTQLLETLRKIENKKIIKSKIESSRKSSISNKSEFDATTPNSSPEQKIIDRKSSSKSKKRISGETKDFVQRHRLSIIDKFINSGKNLAPSYIKDSPTREITAITLESKPCKIIKKDKSNNHPKISFNEPSKNICSEHSCFFCEKATVVAIGCEGCGNLIRKVLCRKDMAKSRFKLRNPNALQIECPYSPVKPIC